MVEAVNTMHQDVYLHPLQVQESSKRHIRCFTGRFQGKVLFLEPMILGHTSEQNRMPSLERVLASAPQLFRPLPSKQGLVYFVLEGLCVSAALGKGTLQAANATGSAINLARTFAI